MKSLLLISILSLSPGLRAAAGEDAAWKAEAYREEFLFIEDAGRYDEESWEALAGEARRLELEKAAERAPARKEEVLAYYAAMTRKWTLQDAAEKLAYLSERGIRSVRIWLGPDHAAYLERKRAALAPLRGASSAAPLTEDSLKAAAPYLTPAAAAELKASLRAGAEPPQAHEKKQKRQAELAGRLDAAKGAYGESVGSGGGEKFFDGAGQRGSYAGEPELGLPKGAGLNAGAVSGNFRNSHASTVSGADVPEIYGKPAAADKKAPGFSAGDLARIDSVVADMKQKRQAAGSENGWLGNFRQSVGLTKADSGCSGWSEAAINAIKSDPELSKKYEVGYVRGLRNPIGAVTKWPPSAPIPLPHFVAVVWPKGTDPNDTAIYVDSWASQTKRGPIKDYTYEYSFDPKDLTPTVYYNKEVQRVVKMPGGKTRVVTETVETPVPLVKSNPWIFVK